MADEFNRSHYVQFPQGTILMDGLEETWKETNRPEAIYTNLPPGDYVLLNASNISGQWSRYVRKLAITIQPPLLATWWAVGLYILLGLGIAWELLQPYLNRLRLNQAIRLRQQEADQLRAVDAIKTNFFTNITHEFRPPHAASGPDRTDGE